MLVAVDDDFPSHFIQCLPDGSHFWMHCVSRVETRAEQRMMPVGQRAGRAVRGQVAAQPLLFGRACFTAADSHAIAVDNHDVPGTQIVAVVSLAGVTGGGPQISKISTSAPFSLLLFAPS